MSFSYGRTVPERRILVFWPANRENKFKSKIIAQFIPPTYKPSIKNGGQLNLKTYPKNSVSTVTPSHPSLNGTILTLAAYKKSLESPIDLGFVP